MTASDNSFEKRIMEFINIPFENHDTDFKSVKFDITDLDSKRKIPKIIQGYNYFRIPKFPDFSIFSRSKIFIF